MECKEVLDQWPQSARRLLCKGSRFGPRIMERKGFSRARVKEYVGITSPTVKICEKMADLRAKECGKITRLMKHES